MKKDLGLKLQKRAMRVETFCLAAERRHFASKTAPVIAFSRTNDPQQKKRGIRWGCLSFLVRVTGLEPARRDPLDPKSSAYANFAIPANEVSWDGEILSHIPASPAGTAQKPRQAFLLYTKPPALSSTKSFFFLKSSFSGTIPLAQKPHSFFAKNRKNPIYKLL